LIARTSSKLSPDTVWVVVLARLRGIVGPGHVMVDPAVTAGYARDWTGRFVGTTPAVVRPADTAEVAAVIRVCAESGIPVVPQGGNTGLVGGGVPTRGEIVLSLRRLAGEVGVDAVAATATAGAGVPVGVLRAAAGAAGLAYGVDLASRDSATVGGTVATNAGGMRVLRHGDTRAQLRGVEAVLGDGSVVSHLGGLARDNTGYHLPSLLAGSEGTLGIVTRVCVRLVAASPDRAVGLLGMASVPAAVAAAARLRDELTGVEAVELMLAAGLELVLQVSGSRPPLRDSHAAYLLVEVGGSDATGALADAVAGLAGVEDAALATDRSGRAALWAYRERHTESINTLGPPVKMDVTLPLAGLEAFIQAVPGVVEAAVPGTRTWLFGHIAEGSVHVNVTGAGAAGERVEDAVFRLVASSGGSISTEHGIGTAKRRWLPLTRSATELATFRRLKQALDPAGILNPNALIPPL
jgi:FAD/FMN-containing dehydrogenase